MFEKEIKFICDFCFNKINKAGSFLTFEKLKGIEIHPAILSYISAELDSQIYKDRKILLQKSSFDYSGAEISKYFKMIASEIKRSKRIGESEINDMITSAVKFNINFITKPNETLVNFIFPDIDTKSPDDIIMYLDYTYYYGYLRQILISYFEQKQLLTVDKKDFEFLLSKIDTELLATKTNEIINSAISAFSDFFNIGAVLRSQIPPQALEAYLKEKHLDDHLSRLQNAKNLSLKTKHDVEEIKKIIYSSVDLTERKSEIKNYDVPAFPTESELQKSEVEVSDNLNSNIESDKSEKITTAENLTVESKSVEIEDLELSNPEVKEPVDLSNEITIEEKVETFPINTDELEEINNDEENNSITSNVKNDKEILSFLTEKEIQRIISSVFNDDQDDFATTIEEVSECISYEKATEVLKNLYTTNNVNPYSRDAILLTNAVAKYFTTA
ncbi:MAG: hypothetical protein HXY50_16640 [Ignavibacteriaceae bacterium]|nr:hypothetical protein [Ignavibacteriaceae bacterium]